MMPGWLKRPGEGGQKGLKLAIFVLALVPLARLITAGLTSRLGANPIEKILHNTGFWTLSLLMLTLAVTPLRQWTGLVWLGRFRRMLGLFAFFYACLHLFTYAVLDQFFDWPNILKDVRKRPYVTIGFSALLMLIPLAATSTEGMIRRLGGARWRKLHRLVYVIALLGVVHFWWLVKKDITQPLAFAVTLSGLLISRAAYARRH
jgi:methionine sulfoxide reductase heme-binding subunit